MRRLTFAFVLAVMLFAGAAASAATPTKVVDDRNADEISVAASTGYLAWSANSEARPRHYNAYVRPVGAIHATRVNPKGTNSYEVGIDGSMVVYEADRHDQSDLHLYDASTKDRPAMPDGVNTDHWEARPSLSGDWLLFSRFSETSLKVILLNISSDETRVLRTYTAHDQYLVSDQVNGDWATFEHCRLANGRYSNCNVFRYQISTKQLVKIDNPGVQQYAGGVSADGTVYLVRTAGKGWWRCGHHARIVRYPVGGPGVVVARFGDGVDAYVTYATDESAGSTTLYMQRVRCSSEASGVYQIANADTVA